jgi:hypothetical protein
MSVLFSGILMLLAVLPAIAAAIKLPSISSEFDPFIVCIWFYGFNAGISYPVMDMGYYNIFHYNMWFLADAYCLLWAFKKWNLFASKKFYYSIAVFFGVCWLLETVYFSKLIGDYNSYFRIIYTFTVILMSISMINTLLLKATINPFKNSIFLICCTLILLDTISLISEAFFAYNLVLSNQFRIYMDHINTYINALCSIIFALIILWLPRKQAFTLQY